MFCSFAICALSGRQKVDARSHFDASCQRACLLCFTLCPQPGPPTATPTAFATANYSTRAQWQMELGSCFRAPTICQLICKANQSALNALVFSLFWVSVARRFFMRELPPWAMDRPLKGANCPSPAASGGGGSGGSEGSLYWPTIAPFL